MKSMSDSFTRMLSLSTARVGGATEVSVEGEAVSICQQGNPRRKWLIKPTRDASKWTNPLTGWSSICQLQDTLHEVDFPSVERAVEYCKRHGLEFTIAETRKEVGSRRVGSTIISGALRKGDKPKNYGDNFSVQRKGVPVVP